MRQSENQLFTFCSYQAEILWVVGWYQVDMSNIPFRGGGGSTRWVGHGGGGVGIAPTSPQCYISKAASPIEHKPGWWGLCP